jgi:hypothetical protein
LDRIIPINVLIDGDPERKTGRRIRCCHRLGGLLTTNERRERLGRAVGQDGVGRDVEQYGGQNEI